MKIDKEHFMFLRGGFEEYFLSLKHAQELVECERLRKYGFDITLTKEGVRLDQCRVSKYTFKPLYNQYLYQSDSTISVKGSEFYNSTILNYRNFLNDRKEQLHRQETASYYLLAVEKALNAFEAAADLYFYEQLLDKFKQYENWVAKECIRIKLEFARRAFMVYLYQFFGSRYYVIDFREKLSWIMQV